MVQYIRQTVKTHRVRRLHKNGLANMVEAYDLLMHMNTLNLK